MSLISDADFLIHSIRLSYLRDVDDIYGSRIITLDPGYSNNPYISNASLADARRWPELHMPSSPNISDDEERPAGFPGAQLNYTRTIMGRRAGGLGLRVHGKRGSTSKRMSGTVRHDDVKNFVSQKGPVVSESLVTPAPVSTGALAQHTTSDDWIKVTDDSGSHPTSSSLNVQIQQPTVQAAAPVVKVVQFIPKFKVDPNAEARRRARMAARRGPTGPPAPPAAPLRIDSSSSEDEAVPIMVEESSDEPDQDSMDDGDEFDPDFISTRIAGSDDDLTGAPGSVTSVSNSSARVSPRRRRLSPVTERKPHVARDSSEQQTTTSQRRTQEKHSTRRPSGTTRPLPSPSATAASHSNSGDIIFGRKHIVPVKSQVSLLTKMLASSSNNANPFSGNYAAISGRAGTQSDSVQVFFPNSNQPAKAMELNVRKDATVEEVIGFALWTYWEEGWLPKLDEGLNGEDDPKWGIKISAVGWIMRIAEEDGEVDDDFPPPDRLGKISKFNADAYAVLEANPTQIAQNQLIENKIQRRPSRMAATPRKSDRLVPPAPPPVPSSVTFSQLGSLPLSTTLPSSSHGPLLFLKISVPDAPEAAHISTKIQVTSEMYMQEALESVCKRRRLSAKDYALLLGDKSMLIPLDRTVASLQGKRELLLVKKSKLNEYGGEALKAAGRTTDPNASIFKRMSDAPEVKISSALDFTAAYKKYTIYRKMPMLVARQERTLAIDGVYLHIMPSNKAKAAVFDSGKTWSYHIKSIADCQQSTKSSSIFKLVLNRAGGNKRYDFEAESPKLAAEIVQMVRSMKTALERSGTVKQSRRSRQVA